MSLDEIDQNSNPNGSTITLSTSVNNNDNNANKPTETDLLNDPETALETTYKIEKESISQVNTKKTQGFYMEDKPYLFYGNHIQNLHPKYLGKTRAFFYYNDSPLIIIGPDCKFVLII